MLSPHTLNLTVMGLAPDLMPIELDQADLDALSDFFGDLDPSEILLE